MPGPGLYLRICCPPLGSCAQVSFPSGPSLARGQEAHLTVGGRPLQVPRLLRRCSGRGPGRSWRDAPTPTHAAMLAGHSSPILSISLGSVLQACITAGQTGRGEGAKQNCGPMGAAPRSPYRLLKPGSHQAAPGGGVCLTPTQPDPDMWACRKGRGGSQGSRVQVGGGLPRASVSPAVPGAPRHCSLVESHTALGGPEPGPCH